MGYRREWAALAATLLVVAATMSASVNSTACYPAFTFHWHNQWGATPVRGSMADRAWPER